MKLRRILILVLTALCIVAIGIGAALAAGLFSGTVNSGNVTVTSTATAALAITSAVENGVGCTINAAKTIASCPGLSVGQAGTFTLDLTVANQGGATDPSVSVSCGGLSLSGSSCALTAGTSPTSIGAGSSVAWAFQYTAGQTTGTDSFQVAISG